MIGVPIPSSSKSCKKVTDMNMSRKKSNPTPLAIVGSLASVALGFAILLALDFFFPFQRGSIADLDLSTLRLVLSSVSLILSIYLIFIYLRDYLQLRAPFTLGLIAAVWALMMFALTSCPILHRFFSVGIGMGPFSIFPLFFATLALGVLAWTSSR